ncbi:MAG: YHS domain-containing protein [Nitrospirales bacterium]|nr:YHS domain-containing protein [Nitrospira sp.]MDR4500690.1 YHS domain-containing protein [Nitrospirales bacterium]
MYRIIIILILLIILFYMVRRAIRDWNKKETPENLLAKDAMIQDPVCQVYITADSAITKRINEQTYYFCSQDCANSFLEKHPS